MRIDKHNLHLLHTNEVYVHDDIYVGMQYDYEANCLVVRLLSEDETRQKTITFYNVLGYQMIACDFWGRSPHVLSWVYNLEERHSFLKAISEECNEYLNEDIILSRKIGHGVEYVETMFLLSSGDRLVVACEYIDYCCDL